MTESSLPSFCPQAITTLVDVITGGPGGTTTAERFGVYPTRPELETFLGNCNIDLRIGAQSRLPTVREVLTRTNRLPDAVARLRPVFEVAVNRASYSNDQGHSDALERLNGALRQDGYELVQAAGRYRLLQTGIDAVAASAEG